MTPDQLLAALHHAAAQGDAKAAAFIPWIVAARATAGE